MVSCTVALKVILGEIGITVVVTPVECIRCLWVIVYEKSIGVIRLIIWLLNN